MRIAVLGDFHINEQDVEMTERAMQDVRACHPDLVVPLGDFGSNRLIGTVEGIQQAHALLRQIGAPLRPILGNHDLEKESGTGKQAKRTMETEMMRLFGLASPSGIIEYEHWRLLFVCIEPQPEHSCYQVQECYVSEEQFQWICDALSKRPGIPVILFTHAPPMGSGLRTVPAVHVRATNAYMDHNHHAGRWIELLHDHPAIVLWFSAHCHLGHTHPDSHSVKFGATFVTTGVHGSCTRDGSRQSRVLDMDGSGFRIYTLDHVARTLNATPDIVATLRPWKMSPDHLQATALGCRRISTCPLGDKPPLPNGVVPLAPDRCLAATEDGFLWEADMKYESVIGTLHWGEAVSSATVSGHEIWWAYGNKLACANRSSMQRFHRDDFGKVGKDVLEFDSRVTAVSADHTGAVWIGSGRSLYRRFEHSVHRIGEFCSEIVKMCASDQGIALLTTEGALYDIVPAKLGYETRMKQCHVRDWDSLNGEETTVYGGSGKLNIRLSGPGGTSERMLPFEVPREDDRAAFPTQIVSLGSGRMLILHCGALFAYHMPDGSLAKLGDDTARAVAIARGSGSGLPTRVYVALESNRPLIRPQLETWTFV